MKEKVNQIRAEQEQKFRPSKLTEEQRKTRHVVRSRLSAYRARLVRAKIEWKLQTEAGSMRWTRQSSPNRQLCYRRSLRKGKKARRAIKAIDRLRRMLEAKEQGDELRKLTEEELRERIAAAPVCYQMNDGEKEPRPIVSEGSPDSFPEPSVPCPSCVEIEIRRIGQIWTWTWIQPYLTLLVRQAGFPDYLYDLSCTKPASELGLDEDWADFALDF